MTGRPGRARLTKFETATYWKLPAGTVIAIEARHGRGLDYAPSWAAVAPCSPRIR